MKIAVRQRDQSRALPGAQLPIPISVHFMFWTIAVSVTVARLTNTAARLINTKEADCPWAIGLL